MHIALILDGNRRWAKKRFLPKSIGHKKGIENFEAIIKYAAMKRDDVEVISAFALSTENLQREAKELQNLFKLFKKFASKKKEFIDYGISVRFWGNMDLLPQDLQALFAETEAYTCEQKNLIVNLCVAYGGRDSLIRAGKKLCEAGQDWNEENLAKNMDSASVPALDLLVRTGGKYRISNFLIWESAYAELYFSDKMWPAFGIPEFEEAIEFFHQQKRTFGQ